MRYLDIAQAIQNLSSLPNGTEKNKQKAEIRKNISNLFVKVMKPNAQLLRQLEQAERTQNLKPVSGILQKLEQTKQEGLVVLRLYENLDRA